MNAHSRVIDKMEMWEIRRLGRAVLQLQGALRCKLHANGCEDEGGMVEGVGGGVDASEKGAQSIVDMWVQWIMRERDKHSFGSF